MQSCFEPRQLGCGIISTSAMYPWVLDLPAQSLSLSVPPAASWYYPPSTTLPTTYLCRAEEPGDPFPSQAKAGALPPLEALLFHAKC